MSVSQQFLAHRNGGSITLAQTPARLRWEFSDLASADGHSLRVSFHASLRGVDDPTERKALDEMLLRGRDALSAADAQLHYQPLLAAPLVKLTREHPVAHWLGDTGRTAIAESLKKTAKDVSFACGLEVLPPFQLDVDSPTLRQQQSAAMQRALAEQQTAGRLEHFSKAVKLLKDIETQQGAAGTKAVTAAIDSLSPADRGAMLRTLLMAGSGKEPSTALWAVAGSSLLRFDLAGDRPADVRKLETPLGPFRSVQAATIDDRPHLLIGCRDGVLSMPLDGEPTPYRDAGVVTQQGFSSAIVHSGRIIATHSEAGLVLWTVGQPDQPAVAIRPDKLGGSPRYVQPLGDECVVFAVGGRLVTVDFNGAVEPIADAAPADVVSLLLDGQRIIAAYEDGALRALDRASKHLITLEHRGQSIATASTLPWIGGTRLLLAGEAGAIDCVGTDDDMVTQYQSPHRGVRRITASLSHVAALSADRGRLIVWNTWDGKTPAREIPLVGVTPHRAGDLLLT